MVLLKSNPLTRYLKVLLTLTFLHFGAGIAAAQSAPIRLNAGGPLYTDSGARSWAADSCFSGGTTYSRSSAIANTPDPTLYRTERYGNFSYNIPVSAGTYLVTLHFAEIYFTSAGQRIFDVSAEGSLKLDNFDIVAKAGANTAYRNAFTQAVTDGTLNLVFSSVVNNAKISAIEIEPAEWLTTPTSLTFGSIILGQTSAAQSVQIQNKGSAALTVNSVGIFGSGAASFKAGGTYPLSIAAGQSATIPITFAPAYEGSNTATLEFVPQQPLQPKDVALNGTGVKPAAGTGTKLVNSGGSAFIDTSGRQWSADSGFSGGTAYSTTAVISDTSNQALYRTERYGNFLYHLPVAANGTYDVTLHFAEIFFSAVGKRIFDVYAENILAVSNLDIYAEAGRLKPLTKTFTIFVQDGAVDLEFAANVDNAKVSGIEIKPSSSTPLSPPPASTIPNEKCSNVRTNPAVIWCDDFEGADSLSTRYSQYYGDDGDFVQQPGVGINGSSGMRVIWQPGEIDAGHFTRTFGRGPAWIKSQSNTTQDFRELYWRIYMQDAPGWSGAPYKLSRATIFASDTSWAQAMIAHVWSDVSDPILLIDSASGVKGGTVVTTTYNDFPNLTWLGVRRGTTPVFASANAGKWYCIEAHAKLNTPGASDGFFEMWVDNQLEARAANLNWVGSWQKYGMNAVMIENYWNTGAPNQRIRYLDNLIISSQRIGCGD